MIPAKHFYMMRHGETEANAAKIMAGSMNSPLTETGRAQARAAQRILEELHPRPTAILHSHLDRARETAEILNETLNIPMTEEPDFAELDAGEWEGVPYDNCRPILSGWEDPPGGERFSEFFDRIKRGKQNALSKNEGPVLIVCHGGVMRAVGKIYGLNTPGIFKNAHLYEFIPTDDQKHFPWQVFDYEICCKTNSIIKNKSDAYASSLLEDEIA